jgi:tRNA U34 5-carboxymethylaminomethyl modifying GTPase MnmE/TrmE
MNGKEMKKVSDKISKIVCDHLDRKDIEKFNNIYKRITGEDAPRIVVYGVYNAGKSSLVNALTGKEAAPVGKRPTTDKISEYIYNDSVLLDTPGIDAPIEHEEIAKNTLYSADAVVFVMQNSGSFDCTITAQELVALIKRGIPALIVLTRRDDMTTKDPGFSQILHKLQLNIRAAAQREGIKLNSANFPDVFLVDTKIAFEGKKSGDKEMTESSGIVYFENRLNNMIAKCDKGKRRKQAFTEISQEVIPLIMETVEKKLPSEEIKTLQEQISRIENRKNTFIAQSLQDAKTILKNYGNQLRGEVELEDEAVIKDFINIILQNSETILDYFDNIGIKVDIPGVNYNDFSEYERNTFFNSDNIRNLRYIMGNKGPLIIKKLQKGIMSLGKMTGKMKYAAKASQLVGKAAPWIAGALTLLEIGLLVKESKDQEQSLIKRELEIENAIRTWETETLIYFKEIIENFADSITSKPLKELAEQMDALSKDNSSLKSLLKEIKDIRAVVAKMGRAMPNPL